MGIDIIARGLAARIVTDAANTLALRNGTSGQSLRVYNTTNAATTNYERGVFQWAANRLVIGTEAGGTGVSRAIAFAIPGAIAWVIDGTGHLVAFTDSTYDIGVSGASRPRDVFIARNITFSPQASVTPANNGEVMFQATGNTSFTIKLKGSDGVVRSGSVTLS